MCKYIFKTTDGEFVECLGGEHDAAVRIALRAGNAEEPVGEAPRGGGEAPPVIRGGVIVDQHQGVGENHQAAEQEPANELNIKIINNIR